MPPEPSRPRDGRAMALSLLRDGSLSIAAVARRVGVSRQTVERWNAASGARPRRLVRQTLARWPQSRRMAVARLLAAAEVDPADLAEAAGFGRNGASLLRNEFGVPERDERGIEADAITPARLRARLLAHVGRQIATLDAALSDAPKAGIDSAKVLRDLGGLKRLLDDLSIDGEGEGSPRDEPAHPEPDLDLDALRAEVARRFDRFVEGGAPD